MPLAPSDDTALTQGTSGTTRRYFIDANVPVGPPEDTVVTLGYQWVHQEIESSH